MMLLILVILFQYNDRNYDPPIWYDTTIKLFQVHKVTGPVASSQEQPTST